MPSARRPSKVSPPSDSQVGTGYLHVAISGRKLHFKNKRRKTTCEQHEEATDTLTFKLYFGQQLTWRGICES